MNVPGFEGSRALGLKVLESELKPPGFQVTTGILGFQGLKGSGNTAFIFPPVSEHTPDKNFMAKGIGFQLKNPEAKP